MNGNHIMAMFNGAFSGDVAVRRELFQGCPLFPVLYVLYSSGMKKVLEQTGIGFTLRHMQHGDTVECRLPGLSFADDLVLMADNVSDMKKMTIACEAEAARLRLQFSANKSAVALFSGQGEGLESLTFQNTALPVSSRYKYLGVTLTSAEDYVAEHYENLKATAMRKRTMLCRKSLWNCDRYVITHELWKAVAVLGLTVASAVTRASSEIRQYLEWRQRGIGRQALGCYGRAANELV